MYEQLDIFSLMEQEEPTRQRLSVGDYIGKLILGEVIKGKIYKVEGNETHFFYRTDKGCFNADDRTDFEQMELEAEEIRKQYKTIEIDHFDKFFAVKYPPRDVDGKETYAMVGIYNDMLFWKEDVTYQFLEKPKNLEKAYKEKVHRITRRNPYDKEECEYEVLSESIPTNRLYWSRHGFYSDARYVEVNG